MRIVDVRATPVCDRHGFRDVKLKNGVLDPRLEVDTVRRIRELGGERVRNVRIDPNQAWSVETSIRVLRQFDAYDIETFNLGLSLHSDRELGISTAAIVQLAAAQPMVSHAVDSHLPEQNGEVITEPFRFENGCLEVPAGPGLGVELDREALERHHRMYLEHGSRDEFQDERRREWRAFLPLW